MKKIYISILATLLAVSHISGQTRQQDRSMVVEESYVADFSSGSKYMPYAPSHTLSKSKRIGNYITQPQYLSGYYREDLELKDLSNEVETDQMGVARLGYGLRNTLDALVHVGLSLSPKDRIEFDTKADGENSGLFDGWRKKYYDWDASVTYQHRWERSVIDVDLFTDYKGFNYRPGINADQVTDKQNLWNFGTSVLLNSFATEKVEYHVRLAYNRFSRSNDGAGKNISVLNRLELNSGMFLPLGGNNSLGLDFNIAGGSYDWNSFNGTAAFDNYWNFTFAPYYTYNADRLKIRLGLDMDCLAGTRHSFNLSPDVALLFKLSDSWALFADANGGFREYSANKLYDISPYWSDTAQVRHGYSAVDARAGLSFNRTDSWKWQLYAGYSYNKDEIFQTVADDRFITSALTQRNLSMFKAELSSSLTAIPSFNLNLFAGYYSYFNTDRALLLMRPVARVDLDMHIRLCNYLYTTISYQSAYYKDLKSKQNISLRVDWDITENIAAYMALDNILNREYYDFAGYQHHKFSAMLGVLFRF